MKKSKQLLSVDETSYRLGLRPTTIRRKILEKTIPSVKIGKSVRIPIEAVDAIIADGWREQVGK